MSNKTCIVLIGAPCSGKSSTGKLTASKIDARYISSGDIAREMAKTDTQISTDLSNGKMAPEDRMRKTISSRLHQYFMIEDNDIVILDGFPRFGEQAEWLRNELPHNIDIRYVLFDIRMSAIIERSIHRDRNDDKSLIQRLKYYYNTTLNDLRRYINIIIDAEENSIEECSKLLIIYIKEVVNSVKDC